MILFHLCLFFLTLTICFLISSKKYLSAQIPIIVENVHIFTYGYIEFDQCIVQHICARQIITKLRTFGVKRPIPGLSFKAIQLSETDRFRLKISIVGSNCFTNSTAIRHPPSISLSFFRDFVFV